MKVIHSCTSESFSGLEAYVVELVAGQKRAGHDVELYCRAGTRIEQAAREAGVPTWTIGAQDRPGPALWRQTREGWNARLAAAGGAGGCVLHMHAGGEPKFHFPALLHDVRRVRAILHYHIWINHKKRDPLHRALFALIDEVWTSSESARTHLAAILPVSERKIRVVPYARDVAGLERAPRAAWRAETRAKLAIPDDAPVAVCVSRIEPIKGTRELFDAFVDVAGRLTAAHLVFIGGPSPANDGAERLAREIEERRARLPRELAARLHFVGFTPCEPYLAAADLYVLPSYEECMSLAMLDAAILGLPILGTASGGTPSVARPGESGALVPPRDARGLAVQLERLLSDLPLCRKLGAGARRIGHGLGRDEVFARIWQAYSA